MQEDLFVNLCKNGDRNAMETLYRNYYNILYIIAIRYLADRDLAEDTVQDCFIKVFDSLDKFTWRGNGSLKAWICRVMRNMCIELLRKRKANFLNIDNIKDIKDCDNTDCEERLSEIPNDVVLSFIEDLPDGYRTVFNLYVFEDFSHKEIADMLGINEKSSSSQLARAKATLVKRINEYSKNRN